MTRGSSTDSEEESLGKPQPRDLSAMPCPIELCTMAVHDMQSVLATMAMAASQLSGMVRTPEQKMLAGIIEYRARAQLRLVESLLDLQRNPAGEVICTFSEVNVETVMKQCKTELSVLASGRRHRIRLEGPPEPTVLVCDVSKLFRILENLIVNAIKYTDPGDTLVIRASEVAEQRVRFDVIDHGPGLNAPGNAGGSDTSGGTEGNVRRGMGLEICRRFVEAHGGRFWLDENGPAGCCWSFEIPLEPVLDSSLKDSAKTNTEIQLVEALLDASG